MTQHQLGIAALATLLLALAACGGGSSPQTPEPAAVVAATTPEPAPVASAATPADARVTLDFYSRDRTAGVAKAIASLDTLRAALALGLPPLQNSVITPSGETTVAVRAIVFPALQAARIDVLRAAAVGATLVEVEAALPAAAGADATRALLDGVSRRFFAPVSASFNRNFLASTDTGGSAAAPWQAIQIQDWSAASAVLAEFGAVSEQKLVPQTRLVIGQRFDAKAPANGQAVAFDGVGVRSPDFWYTAPMVALEGRGGMLNGVDSTATATWVGDHLWVSMRPLGNEPLHQGLPPASLSSALLAVWSAFAVPETLLSRSRQVWPQQAMTLEDRSRLPTGIALPYSALQANLSGLDGGGTYLTETAHEASIAIDTAGLRASGTQAMAFTFSAENLYGGGSDAGSVTTIDPPFTVTPPCPRAESDWRGAYLALIDRAGRLLLVASLPDASGVETRCLPI